MYFTIKHLFILCLLIICYCSRDAETATITTSSHEGHEKATDVSPVRFYNGPPPPPPGNVGPDGNIQLQQQVGYDKNNIAAYAPLNGTSYISSSRTSSSDTTLSYILIFTGILLVIFLIFLAIALRYKSKINGKLKRLEQVKDMQSLEATNMRPLTTITSKGYIEDKREGYSSQSSAMRKHAYAKSISLQSSTSDDSLFEDAYNYVSELDDDNNGYNGNVGYPNQGQYMYDKNMGMKYMSPQQHPSYDGPYHSTPASFGINKNDLKNLYSTPVDNPYDTDEGMMPMKPQSTLYDANGIISPIQNSSPLMSPSVMMPANTYAARNINNMGYNDEIAYNNNYEYNDEQLMYGGAGMNIPPKAIVSDYNQIRGEPRIKRKSYSELNKGKHGTIQERSPGLYAPINPMNESPLVRKGASSVISETRSAKSILIDQMVHEMDIEAESDDTLSNYPINDDRSSVAGSNVNGRSRGSNVSAKELSTGKSSNGSQSTKVTSISSSDKDTNKAYTNQAINVNGRISVSNDALRKKKIRVEPIGRHERNRDFMGRNIFSQESDSFYESNNSFNQSIYDEVKVFEVEEDEDLIINSADEYGRMNRRK